VSLGSVQTSEIEIAASEEPVCGITEISKPSFLIDVESRKRLAGSGTVSPDRVLGQELG
jgi:hypothetical protein